MSVSPETYSGGLDLPSVVPLFLGFFPLDGLPQLGGFFGFTYFLSSICFFSFAGFFIAITGSQ
jgi:hypothetical protein